MGAFQANNHAEIEKKVVAAVGKKSPIPLSEILKLEGGEVLQQVILLLDIPEKKLREISKNKSSVHDILTAVVKDYSGNEKLAQILLSLDPERYFHLFNKKIQTNPKFLQIALNREKTCIQDESFIANINTVLSKKLGENTGLASSVFKAFIKTKTPLAKVEEFIANIGQRNEGEVGQLQDIWKQVLSQTGRVYSQNLQSLLLPLQIECPILYDFLLEKKIFSENKLNTKKLQKFCANITLDTEETSDANNQKQNILQNIAELFSLSKEVCKIPAVKQFLDFLYDFLDIQSQIDINTTEEEAAGEKTNEPTSDKDSEESRAEEMLDFCNGNCSISYSGSTIIVHDVLHSLQFSQKEFSNFSTQSLENFLEMYYLFCQLGIGFFLEGPNKNSFFQLMSNKNLGFSASSGTGCNQHIQLEALNIVGKLIGIAESYYGDDGELSDFANIPLAVAAFEEINATGKIREEKLVNPSSLFSRNASYKQLQKLGILTKGGVFLHVSAGEVLKDSKKYFGQEPETAEDILPGVQDTVVVVESVEEGTNNANFS